jgi:hypothetical protein
MKQGHAASRWSLCENAREVRLSEGYVALQDPFAIARQVEVRKDRRVSCRATAGLPVREGQIFLFGTFVEVSHELIVKIARQSNGQLDARKVLSLVSVHSSPRTVRM